MTGNSGSFLLLPFNKRKPSLFFIRSFHIELSIHSWEGNRATKKSKKTFRSNPRQLSLHSWKGRTLSEREVLQMQKESIEKTASLDGTDEELIDVLIAISVIAKRLARKLQNEQKGECQHEQNE